MSLLPKIFAFNITTIYAILCCGKTNMKPGYKFLKTLWEKPKFVCTCCHQWLFRKTLIVFDQNKYDFNNDIVQKALSSKYRHKMDVEVKTGTRCPHANPTNYDYLLDSDVDDDNEQGECSSSKDFHAWPSYSTNYLLTDVVYKTYEYICVCLVIAV